MCSQFLRARVNCTKDKDFIMESIALASRFRERGYPSREIWAQFDKIRNLNRNQLLFENRTNPAQDRMVFVTLFDRETDKALKESLSTLWNDLLDCPVIRERGEFVAGPVLPESRPILAYKCGRSLGSTLGPFFKRGHRAERDGHHNNHHSHEERENESSTPDTALANGRESPF